MPKKPGQLKENNISNKIQLTEKETLVLERWKGESFKAPLPLELAMGMYELYLNGYTCDEIYRINGGKIPLGQILDARVRYTWDESKLAQLSSMHQNIDEKVLKTKNDAIIHITDTLAAFHKLFGDRFKKFIQDGDPAHLGQNTENFNLKMYKDLVSMLEVLTKNKDSISEKKVEVGGTVNHVHSVESSTKSNDVGSLLDMIEAGEIVDVK